MRRLALKRALAERVDAGTLVLIDSIELSEPKTRLMAQLLKALNLGENVLVVDCEFSRNVQVAARNMPDVETVRVDELNVYRLLLHHQVLMTRRALDALGSRLTTAKEAG